MKKNTLPEPVRAARKAAIEVLTHNMSGPYHGLPRTAGWGYPEPYTRDLMISGLGLLVAGRKPFVRKLRRVLETLAENQTPHGHITSLAHDPKDVGASDTTPLFLMMAAIFRKFVGEPDFLKESIARALVWMDYQSPDDDVMVGQLPTSDWRDEQWVLGYGLYVNTVVYSYLSLLGEHKKADRLHALMNRFTVFEEVKNRHVHEGLVVKEKPYYALWSYKVLGSERFDLLGNALAILTGIASETRAASLVKWIEQECDALVASGNLKCDLPPNFFPYIQPGAPDWRPRYERFNKPGEYHNGGVWPFICGFYIAALVAAGRQRLAERKLLTLTELVRLKRTGEMAFGFNEWIHAMDGTPRGQDWQTWSAAMYLYAVECVKRKSTPFFDEIRQARWDKNKRELDERAKSIRPESC